jgi:rRNA maturation protein Nop10
MTQKTSCIPVQGEVQAGGRRFGMDGAFASLDYSHGLYARRTRWRWASACGRTSSGERVGLNFADGHNEVENCVWLGGELLVLAPARFEFDPADPMKEWRVATADGRVDLRFTPEGLRREDTDLKLAVSRYVQPIGSFHGTLLGPGGRRVEVAGLPGVTEDHEAVW